MFSSKSKAKNQSKRPAPAQATSSSGQKAGEKPRTAKPQAGQETTGPEAQETRAASKNTSSLNPHLHFEGDLKFSGTVLVDCDFAGTVTTDDTLVVGVNGTVRAELTAGVVEVSGKVHGNIRAAKNVKIYSGGEVHGNIETPTISMEEGVIFEGACTRPGTAARSTQQVESAKAEVSERPAPAEPKTTTEPSALETARKRIIASTPDLVEAR